MSSVSASNSQTTAIITDDGYRLLGTLYFAQSPLKGRMVVAGATAVPQGFYRRFALFCAEQGYETLTFDYRGIGWSKPTNLKGFRMNLLDWGQQDLAAAIDSMSDDTVPLYVVGHSYGGHALGLLPNHHLVKGLYVFGTGAGWHGYMPPLERVKVQLMWKTVLPALTYWKGYCPWAMLGLGEDLPIDVFLQWRHWCQYPRYFFDDPNMTGLAERYADVKTPIYAVNALDDLWALPKSRDAFLEAYRNAPQETLNLDPKMHNAKIGHMGYFRQHAKPMWENTLAWFEHQTNQRESYQV